MRFPCRNLSRKIFPAQILAFFHRFPQDSARNRLFLPCLQQQPGVMPVALHGPAERPGGRQTFQPQLRQCGPGRVQQLLNFSGQAAQNRVLLLPQLPGQYQSLHLLHMGEQVPQGEQHRPVPLRLSRRQGRRIPGRLVVHQMKAGQNLAGALRPAGRVEAALHQLPVGGLEATQGTQVVPELGSLPGGHQENPIVKDTTPNMTNPRLYRTAKDIKA